MKQAEIKTIWVKSGIFGLTLGSRIRKSVTSSLFSCAILVKKTPDAIWYKKKSRIRETMNLSTDADHRTDIFLGGGWKKKKN